MFSVSSPCQPLGCPAAAMLPKQASKGELSENMLQNLRYKLPPQTAEPWSSVPTTINLWLSFVISSERRRVTHLLYQLLRYCWSIQGAAVRASVAHWTARAPKRTTSFGSMWVDILPLQNPLKQLMTWWGSSAVTILQTFIVICEGLMKSNVSRNFRVNRLFNRRPSVRGICFRSCACTWRTAGAKTHDEAQFPKQIARTEGLRLTGGDCM